MPRKFTPLAERFWSRVDRQGPDDCWLWLGALKGNGYGVIGAGGERGRTIYVHRLSYDLTHRDEPLLDGQNACHTCDVRWPDNTYRRCVNPAHLFAGTQQENMDDAVSKGRMRAGVRHGLNLHPERVPKGENRPFAKLTEEAVRLSREERRSLKTPYRVLAERYGVSVETMHRAVNGKLWAHVK